MCLSGAIYLNDPPNSTTNSDFGRVQGRQSPCITEPSPFCWIWLSSLVGWSASCPTLKPWQYWIPMLLGPSQLNTVFWTCMNCHWLKQPQGKHPITAWFNDELIGWDCSEMSLLVWFGEWHVLNWLMFGVWHGSTIVLLFICSYVRTSWSTETTRTRVLCCIIRILVASFYYQYVHTQVQMTITHNRIEFSS
jgi:hypothetical protein